MRRHGRPGLRERARFGFDEVKKARWASTAEVKRSYATASVVTAERIVFNVNGPFFLISNEFSRITFPIEPVDNEQIALQEFFAQLHNRINVTH